MSRISILIPCYQVEGNLPVTSKVLFETEKSFPAGTEVEYVFIDDGSTDQTFAELEKIKRQKPNQVKIVKLARNFGSNNAVLAGMRYATGDCCCFLAADLQDPPDLIPKMFEYWSKGIKLVIANREAREENFTRRMGAGIYHFMMRTIFPTKVPSGGFDLMLFDKKLREEVVRMDEKNAYVPYLLVWLGYDYVNIPYVRAKREIGQSMWTFSKKVKAAIDSLIAFSFAPVRLISIVGLVLGIVAFVYLSMIVHAKYWGSTVKVDGWASLMVVLLAVSGFQMISMGIIGEYVWRTLDATRKRPNFVVDEVLGEEIRNKNIPKVV